VPVLGRGSVAEIDEFVEIRARAEIDDSHPPAAAAIDDW
jgi:hypothetical protein